MVTCYGVPEEGTSPQWAKSFAKGCRGSIERGDRLQPGDVAMFGSPRRWNLLQQAQAERRTWWYGDHAYFGRRHWYRITRNAYQHDGCGSAAAGRFEAHGIRLKAWRREGRHVLVCPNSPAFFERFGLTARGWVDDVTAELRRHTDREIRVRFKGDPGDLEQALRDAWACVVYVSVSGLHAALAGVPCFATAPCASLAFGSGDLSLIERPVRPDDRFERACVLAANQWTLAEMSAGIAWKELNR